MKFDDKMKQIVSEWRYTDDPARDYDEYSREQDEYLKEQILEDNIVKNVSSYEIKFMPYNGVYKIVINGQESEVLLKEKTLIDANVSSNEILDVGDVELHYEIAVENNSDEYYVESVLDNEALDFTVAKDENGNERKLDENFYDTLLWDNILEAIDWYFIKYHTSNEIWEEWLNRR